MKQSPLAARHCEEGRAGFCAYAVMKQYPESKTLLMDEIASFLTMTNTLITRVTTYGFAE